MSLAISPAPPNVQKEVDLFTIVLLCAKELRKAGSNSTNVILIVCDNGFISPFSSLFIKFFETFFLMRAS
jgi:hypothetical protein